MASVALRVRAWLRSSRRTVVVLTLVVAVTGGLALTLVAGARRTAGVADRFVAARDRGFDISVEQASGPPREAELAALPGVARVAMATFVFGGLVAAEDTLGEVLVFAGSPEATGQPLLEGRLPDPAHPLEFVASSRWVASSGLALGSVVDLVTFSAAQAADAGFDAGEPRGLSGPAVLVGVLADSVVDESSIDIAVFPATMLTAGDVGISASFGVVELTAGTTEDDLRSQLDGLADGGGIALEPLEVLAPTTRSSLGALGTGLWIVAAIVGAAVAVVTAQLLGRRVRLSAPDLQILRGLGASNAQLRPGYCSEGGERG